MGESFIIIGNYGLYGYDAMIHARDHKTPYLADPWNYLGPKRRKLLDESWAGLFQEHILTSLPVDKIASCYTEGFGRLFKPWDQRVFNGIFVILYRI